MTGLETEDRQALPILLDIRVWSILVENLEDAVVDVADAYLEDTPRRIIEMRQAFAEDDYESVGRLAHSLKSSSAIFGAKSLSNISYRLEMAADQRDEHTHELLGQVERLSQSVMEEISRMIRLPNLGASEIENGDDAGHNRGEE